MLCRGGTFMISYRLPSLRVKFESSRKVYVKRIDCVVGLAVSYLSRDGYKFHHIKRAY